MIMLENLVEEMALKMSLETEIKYSKKIKHKNKKYWDSDWKSNESHG